MHPVLYCITTTTCFSLATIEVALKKISGLQVYIVERSVELATPSKPSPSIPSRMQTQQEGGGERYAWVVLIAFGA
jgi:hypothetical protein